MNEIQNKNDLNKKTDHFPPIRSACEWFGGVHAFARALGISPQLAHRWAAKQQAVPIIRCVEIEELTAGMVTRKQLRPDDWWLIWPELRDK